jgi:hypothetical protein
MRAKTRAAWALVDGVSSDCHQDLVVLGPVQNSFKSYWSKVAGEDALYVEVLYMVSPFAGGNARQIGFGSYPELRLFGGVRPLSRDPESDARCVRS